MSEQILEPQVQPKAGESVGKTAPQPTFNYGELTTFLDKYFEGKAQAQQKADQVLQNINSNDSMMNNGLSVSQPVESWQQGLNALTDELAKTIDTIRDLLDYDDYDNAAFDHRLNADSMKKKRQFWLHSHLLGGKKMAEMLVDKIRRGKKDYAIFNAGMYR